MEKSKENAQFNALRNALYHSMRQKSLDRLNRFFNLIIVILGAASVGSFLGGLGVHKDVTGILIAISGSMQLILDYSRRSMEHHVLQREYFNILSEIEGVESPTVSQINSWYSSMAVLASSEPLTMRAIDAVAYNDAISSLELGENERIVIPFFHRLFGGVFSFSGHFYIKNSEK